MDNLGKDWFMLKGISNPIAFNHVRYTTSHRNAKSFICNNIGYTHLDDVLFTVDLLSSSHPSYLRQVGVDSSSRFIFYQKEVDGKDVIISLSQNIRSTYPYSLIATVYDDVLNTLLGDQDILVSVITP